MGDSEHYVPPPPPYELSLDPDQKVTEARAHDLGPFPGRDEEKDLKHFRTLSDKIQREVAFPSNPKRLVKSASGNLRAARPLPPSPADTRSRGQGAHLGPVADLKSYAAQNDRATEPRPPVPPPFLAIGPPLDEVTYARHPNKSVHPSPFHYPSQPSHNAPRRSFDDRWRVSAYSPVEPCLEPSFRRPSHISPQSPSYSLPQNKDNFAMRLSFDPSVAYSDVQANSRTAFSPQRGVASLYSSAVSSHLHPDSALARGSRQSAPPRPPLPTIGPDKTDVRSAQAHRPVFSYPSSPTSMHVPRTRTRSGYEQRWATSESDITRDVYQG